MRSEQEIKDELQKLRKFMWGVDEAAGAEHALSWVVEELNTTLSPSQACAMMEDNHA